MAGLAVAALALGAGGAQAAGFSGSAQPIVATEGAPFAGPVARFTTAPAGSICPSAPSADYLATIDWGDGDTTVGTISPLSHTASSCTYAVSGAHTWAEEHLSIDVTTVVRLICSGSSCPGPGGSVSGDAAVADAPLSSTPATISPVAGVPFSGAVGGFSDANPLAPLLDYEVSINWGDGAASTGALEPAPGGGMSVMGAHTYASAGSYPLSVTLHDAGGLTTTANGTANVAAPPTTAASRSVPRPKAVRCPKGKRAVRRGRRTVCVKRKRR